MSGFRYGLVNANEASKFKASKNGLVEKITFFLKICLTFSVYLNCFSFGLFGLFV